MKEKILIIDDDAAISRIISGILTAAGYKVEEAGDAKAGLDLLGSVDFSLVLLDLRLPDRDGLEVLSEINKGPNSPPVVIITAHADIPKTVQAVKQGAYDFLAKPLDREALLITVRNAVEQRRLKLQVDKLREQTIQQYRMVGTSKAMQSVYALIDKAAPTDAGILISGANGTGKELVARAVHSLSSRNDREFVKINCAAVPEPLLESELFGFEKGAFTGATFSKKGKLELADGGTLFLDEVGDMTPATQAKLLRFLQEGELEKVGSVGPHKINVRVIAATNKDLPAEIREKRFREDLFYRLNEIPIRVPRLVERKEDIPLLAGHFSAIFSREAGVPEKMLSPSAMVRLTNEEWPGNVRQLKNTIKRLVLLLERQVVETQDIDEVIGMGQDDMATEEIDDLDLRAARDKFEKCHIRKVLAQCQGNMTKAAETLGIERSNLYKKIKQLGMENLVV